MKGAIPLQFLFRYTFDCPYVAPGSLGDGFLLPTNHRPLPFVGAIDNCREIASVYLGWNPNGLALRWVVRQKKQPIYGERERPFASDGLNLWIDTRDTRTIHRATRFCQHVSFAVTLGEEPAKPSVWFSQIHRAQENPPTADPAAVRMLLKPVEAKSAGKIRSYEMNVFLPASVLHGYEPETNSRLGFFFHLRDRELGDQYLTAGDGFPFAEDPSLWSVLDLKSAQKSR